MENPSELSKISRRVKVLTIAVWCLVVINVFPFAVLLVQLIAPEFFVRRIASSSGAFSERLESWEGLSFEEQLERSSIVFIAKNQRQGDEERVIIEAILKRKPNTTFNYDVGDAYLPLTTTVGKNGLHGHGVLVLLQGSPASMSYAYQIYNGSISALGDMPVTTARKLIERSQ